MTATDEQLRALFAAVCDVAADVSYKVLTLFDKFVLANEFDEYYKYERNREKALKRSRRNNANRRKK